MVAGGFKAVIKVVNVARRRVEMVLVGHGSAINEIRTHPLDDALIVSGSKDKSIRMWNIQTGERRAVTDTLNQ